MLRAGYIVSLLERLPYDKEVNFSMNAGPETEVLYDEENDMKYLFSDREKIIVRDNGATIILECGM